MTLSTTRYDDLILTGGATGLLQDQIEAILQAVVTHGMQPQDLCLLRAFHRPEDHPEPALATALATTLAGRAAPAVTFVPCTIAGPADGRLTIEAAAALGPRTALTADDHPAFAAGLRKGRFLFLSAHRAAATGLVPESSAVMRALQGTLARLGASFADIVKMNRWYHAAGTKSEWEPSARATAAFYATPGPIATAISLPEPLPGNRAIQIELMGMAAPDGSALPKTHAWPEDLWDWPIPLPYRHGLACGGLGFVGGQVSLDAQAQVIDPDRLDRQITRALACIDRVAQDLGPVARPLHLGIYHEHPDYSTAGRAGAAMLHDLATADTPAVLAAWPYLSYPQMRVEIEAIVALSPATPAR